MHSNKGELQKYPDCQACKKSADQDSWVRNVSFIDGKLSNICSRRVCTAINKAQKGLLLLNKNFTHNLSNGSFRFQIHQLLRHSSAAKNCEKQSLAARHVCMYAHFCHSHNVYMGMATLLPYVKSSEEICVDCVHSLPVTTDTNLLRCHTHDVHWCRPSCSISHR